MRYPNIGTSITKYVDWKHFATLGVRQWVDDEIINHFVEKWCTQSRATLGLSSFFPVNHLFQDNGNCSKVYSIDQLVGNDTLRYKLLRWANKSRVSFFSSRSALRLTSHSQRAQKLATFDQVFIPINGNRNHWYSACIDYKRKCINIYDSLRDLCLTNRCKPPEQRKNKELMMVLP